MCYSLSMTILYRAHRQSEALHTPKEGWCLTDDIDLARRYGRYVAFVEVDLDTLVVTEVEGYDRVENHTPADSKAFRATYAEQGVDILGYEDENEVGEWHYTWRLISDAASAASRVLKVVDAS